ncbi:unnamed protein product [Cylicocyclus nassatus]|uniref:Uncharacterized protein n=1 Tax=Cylicocyclus nassatus TaxID=53992 RepID=A0AA36GI36_CYLNA|nr:unnamed protein product [Cylicocyclus nassatus]
MSFKFFLILTFLHLCTAETSCLLTWVKKFHKTSKPATGRTYTRCLPKCQKKGLCIEDEKLCLPTLDEKCRKCLEGCLKGKKRF